MYSYKRINIEFWPKRDTNEKVQVNEYVSVDFVYIYKDVFNSIFFYVFI